MLLLHQDLPLQKLIALYLAHNVLIVKHSDHGDPKFSYLQVHVPRAQYGKWLSYLQYRQSHIIWILTPPHVQFQSNSGNSYSLLSFCIIDRQEQQWHVINIPHKHGLWAFYLILILVGHWLFVLYFVQKLELANLPLKTCLFPARPRTWNSHICPALLEMHNFACCSQVSADFEFQWRDGRKLGLRISLEEAPG